MAFKNIKIIDPYVEKGLTPEIKLTLAMPEEVDAVEAKLNVSFPEGYKEYVTTLGLGEYCSYVRVNMPSKILTDYKEKQEFINKNWFWNLGKEVLTKEKAIECIEIADTNDGNVILFHSSNSSELFVLPRHDDLIYKIGSNLYEAIDWLCLKSPYVTRFVGESLEKRYFVPINRFQFTHGNIRPEKI